MLLAAEDIEVSSANNLTVLTRSWGRSLIKLIKNDRPKTEPFNIPAVTNLTIDHWGQLVDVCYLKWFIEFKEVSVNFS